MSKKKQRTKKKPRPTLGLEVRDPYRELVHRMEELERENKQLWAQLELAQKDQVDGFDDTMAHAKEMVEKDRRGMSREDLDRARKTYAKQQALEIAEMQAELKRKHRELMQGKMLSYTPKVTDTMPYGPKTWEFKAGVASKYPKVVITAFEDRQRGLAEYHALKGALGAAGPGDVLREIMVADFTGTPRRPSAEHEALLKSAGIVQRL